MKEEKKDHLLNPQNVPVYCAGQTQVPLTHGLLKKKRDVEFSKFKLKENLPIHTQSTT
jgi:hypothetical protein